MAAWIAGVGTWVAYRWRLGGFDPAVFQATLCDVPDDEDCLGLTVEFHDW
jgi:hypothetical protein